MLALLALSAIYVGFGDTEFITALFAGLAPAVIAIVVQAVYRVGKRSLIHPALVGLAVASFLALALFAVPFPVVVVRGRRVGLARWAVDPGAGPTPSPRRPGAGHSPLISDDALHHDLPSRRRSLTVLAVGLALWFAPSLAFAVAGLIDPACSSNRDCSSPEQRW